MSRIPVFNVYILLFVRKKVACHLLDIRLLLSIIKAGVMSRVRDSMMEQFTDNSYWSVISKTVCEYLFRNLSQTETVTHTYIVICSVLVCCSARVLRGASCCPSGGEGGIRCSVVWVPVNPQLISGILIRASWEPAREKVCGGERKEENGEK